MSAETKTVTYQHLYSLCSVKLMVHWFQIIRERRFQMYDDQMNTLQNIYEAVALDDPAHAPVDPPQGVVLVEAMAKVQRINSDTSLNKSNFVHGHIISRFPTEQIRRRGEQGGPPIAIFYGGSDTLLDMNVLLRGLAFPVTALRGWLKHPDETWDGSDCHIMLDDVSTDGFPLAKTLFDSRERNHPLKAEVTKNASPVCMLKCVPEYEHLCFLWGDHLPQQIYPDIIGLLTSFGQA